MLSNPKAAVLIEPIPSTIVGSSGHMTQVSEANPRPGVATPFCISYSCPSIRYTSEATWQPVREVEVSEFRKIDSSLSCLSLRF